MSVRRLAEESVQPEAFAFNRANAAEAKSWIKKYPRERKQSAIIPLLMLAQDQDGWVTKAAIERVADMLAMPYIRALEVATFYTQFQLKPVGTHAHIQVCGTTPCMLRGSEELIALCKSKINPEPFKTNDAGTMSWEEVECQGACVNAPMAMIFKDTYEDLTVERLAEIIDAFEAGKGDTIKPGPQIDRIFAAPATGPTTLLADPTVKAGAATKARTSPKPAGKPIAAKPKSAMVAGKPVAKAKPAAKPAAKTKPAAKVTAKPAVALLDDKNRPAAMKKPARPDDLKMISGIGPKLEGTLNSLGIYSFAQVASWKKAEREWVDGYLNFKGRIDRDDWVKQAKALAKGGRDEYVRVFGKEPR